MEVIAFFMSSKSKKLIRLYFSIALIAGIFFAVAELFISSSLNLKEYNIIDTPGVSFTISEQDFEHNKLDSNERPVILHCDAQADYKTICGIKIDFSRNEQSKLFASFVPYDHIILSAKASSTNQQYDNRIRVTIRTSSDMSSDVLKQQHPFKSQSIRLISGSNISAPLSDFKVDVWWLDQFGVSLQDSIVDFSKVVSIEILVNEVPIRNYGEYSIELSELKLQGKIIPQQIFWYVLVGFCPLFIIGCVIHAFWIYPRYARPIAQKSFANDKLFQDIETGFFNKNGLIKDYENLVEEGNTSHLYYFQLHNYEQLKKILGLSTALLVLKNHWLFFVERLDGISLTIYRIGESEFVVNSPHNKLSDNEIKYALVRPENDSFAIDKTIVFIPKHYQSPTIEQFIERCQVTAQYCREHGENYTEFSLGHFHKYEEDMYIRQCLRSVLGTNEFYLLYMPYYNSDTNQIVGAEALLRSSASTLYRYSPEVYVKVAEQHGLIKNIDLWVIKHTFETLSQYQDQIDDDFVLSVNISPRQMLDHTFVEELRKLLSQYKVNPAHICLELKETFFVNIEELEATNLGEIKKLGFSIGLDNFGTGYTAFSKLDHIPADQIKIDQSYVSRLHEPAMSVVVNSIINIAKAFDYQLSAEGIETKEQMKQLIDMGCEVFQGFYISDPIKFEQLLNFDISQVKEKG